MLFRSLPPEAFRSYTDVAAVPALVTGATSLTDAVRLAAGADGRSPEERAVELFDLGVALRAKGRYREALDAWRGALALAPDNLVYQANVQRLRAQLRG